MQAVEISKRTMRASDLKALGLALRRPPHEQAALRDRDHCVEGERKCGQYQYACEDCVDVEGALGLQDEITDAPRRTEIFTHHRPHKCHAYRRVQTREYPRHCRRHVNRAQQLLPASTEHTCIVEHHRAHFFYALIDVKEHDKKYQGDAKRDLREYAETKPDSEDRRENYTRHCIHRFNVWVCERRCRGRECEP